MKTINVDLSSGEALNLLVGRQGESGVTQVVFNFSALKTEFGTGTVSLSVKRPKEPTPYAQTITTSGTSATWLVNETDTGVAGCGEIQLTYTVNSQIAKTVVYKYTVYPSIGVDGEYPIPGQTWQEEMEDEIAEIKADLSDLQAEIEGGGSGLTADLKAALDQLAQKVAYIDDDGQDYYDALHNALYPPASLSYITCVYTQSGTVYSTDSLDSLKSDLVVTAHYSNGTTQTVTGYALSGTLTAGTSTITVSYGGKTTTFNVTVTEVIPDYPKTITSSSDGVGFGSIDPTKPNNTPPYTGNSNKNRIRCYGSNALGYPVTEGKSYNISITTTLHTEQPFVIEFNEDGFAQLQSVSAVSSANFHEGNWESLTNDSFTYTPSTINNKPAVAFWIGCRKNTANATWSDLDDSIFPLTITEVTV